MISPFTLCGIMPIRIGAARLKSSNSISVGFELSALKIITSWPPSFSLLSMSLSISFWEINSPGRYLAMYLMHSSGTIFLTNSRFIPSLLSKPLIPNLAANVQGTSDSLYFPFSNTPLSIDVMPPLKLIRSWPMPCKLRFCCLNISSGIFAKPLYPMDRSLTVRSLLRKRGCLPPALFLLTTSLSALLDTSSFIACGSVKGGSVRAGSEGFLETSLITGI